MIPAVHFEFRNLIKKLLTIDPRKRISLEEALNHPFFNEIMDGNCKYFFEQIDQSFNKKTTHYDY